MAAPTETVADEGLYVREPVIPAPAPPVEESPQEPAVAFAGIVNDKPEVEAVKIDLPAVESEEAEEAPAQEAPVQEEQEAPVQEEQEAPVQEEQENQENQEEENQEEEAQEAEEWNEEVNQIQAAQPNLPQQPPSEQQIYRPPPPAS